MEARAQAITVFAVGVGSEITTSELISIANKPSSTYVLYAEDYTTIDRIRGSMEQKLCEGQKNLISTFLVLLSTGRQIRVTPHSTAEPQLSNRLCFWSLNELPFFFLESVCPTRIPVASRDEKGFELMVGMNIEKKAKKIPGSLVSESAYALTASTDITENTR